MRQRRTAVGRPIEREREPTPVAAIRRRAAALAALVPLLLLLGGCGLPWSPAAARPAQAVPVLTDEGEFTAYIGAPGGGAISREEALVRAERVMAHADQATGVRADHAELSLRAGDGRVVLQPRQTWLVTYQGVEFKATQGCTCYSLTRPNTTIAVDAATGQVVLAFGTPA